MNKKDLRHKMILLRKDVSVEKRMEYSNKILNRLIHMPEYRYTEAIYCYVSVKDEVITYQIIEHALNCGKKVAVPKVLDKKMEFYYIADLNDLKEGYWGIPEPITIGAPALDQEVFMVIPGLAFDHDFNRMGYGRGFYDRYLEAHTGIHMFKAAVAFDFQVIDQMEVMEHDKKVDCIVTPTKIERRIIWNI